MPKEDYEENDPMANLGWCRKCADKVGVDTAAIVPRRAIEVCTKVYGQPCDVPEVDFNQDKTDVGMKFDCV